MTLQAAYAGIRVLDLSTNLAGPFAAMILGDLGADVIKIERRPGGDDTRMLPPRWGDEATVFLSVNRNKRSLLLDFKSPEARGAILLLAARADVVIESFPPGVGDELGLSASALHAAKPDVIVCSMSAFGDGPIGSRLPGYDALIQAVSGMMSFTGAPGGEPVRLAPSVLDLSTGLWGAVGIMAALAARTKGGASQHIRPALLDAAFILMCHQVTGYLATGKEPEKLGSGAPSAAPYRVYDASDGALMIATASDAQFKRLCHEIDLPWLASDPRFQSMEGRLAHRAELDSAIAREIATKPIEVWTKRFAAIGISSGRVNDLKHALEMPVAKERGLMVDPERLGWAGGLPLLRLPIDPGGKGVRRAPPKLGEHSTEILREAGFDEAMIARLTSS